MSILSFFRSRQKAAPPAAQAKERLQIVLAHERAYAAAPDYLPKLQDELLQVIAKYVEIDQEKLSVTLENTGTVSRLEVNIELPNTGDPKSSPVTRAPALVAEGVSEPAVAGEAGGESPGHAKPGNADEAGPEVIDVLSSGVTGHEPEPEPNPKRRTRRSRRRTRGKPAPATGNETEKQEETHPRARAAS